MIVHGNQQVSDMLKRGERLIAVGALDSYAADLRKEGHPIKTLYPSDGVVHHPVADFGGEGLAAIRTPPSCSRNS